VHLSSVARATLDESRGKFCKTILMRRPRITVPTIAISLSLSRLSSTRVYHFSPRHTLPPPISYLWLANCYFALDSSGFPSLLRFYDAQSAPSFNNRAPAP
jgi:hypothetical protein